MYQEMRRNINVSFPGFCFENQPIFCWKIQNQLQDFPTHGARKNFVSDVKKLNV